MEEQLSQAERFLLEGIRRGDSEAWSQLVDRYRGRLFAFAHSRMRSSADVEDVLQDAFMTFLKGLGQFRGEAGLETYLFTILRRRMVDFFRGRKRHVCLLHDVVRPDDEGDSGEAMSQVPSHDPTASWYARRDEREDIRRHALAEAIGDLLNGYKKSLNFRDLKIVEMLFYCQLPNKEVGRIAGLDEKQIALIKHRCLRKVREQVDRALAGRGMSPDAPDGDDAGDARGEAMLTRIWETLRLSCPKRSTIGAYHLGTLDADWQDYVGFHLEKLGCEYCRANLADIKSADQERSGAALREKILQSTVGFLRQSYRR
jgi:RNA polymerase sigma factor (sigma-70 family)